jgi:SAM-dependent methyltransferase
LNSSKTIFTAETPRKTKTWFKTLHLGGKISKLFWPKIGGDTPSIKGISMSNVQNFYDENVQSEWDRLGTRHRTEFAVTCRALREFLPPAPARVIDIGGGPGRYALALAEQGYGVTLVDLAEGNLAFAREKPVKRASAWRAFSQKTPWI